MKRRKRTTLWTDEEWEAAKEYADYKGRSVSNFLRYAAKIEMNRHNNVGPRKAKKTVAGNG